MFSVKIYKRIINSDFYFFISTGENASIKKIYLNEEEDSILKYPMNFPVLDFLCRVSDIKEKSEIQFKIIFTNHKELNFNIKLINNEVEILKESEKISYTDKKELPSQVSSQEMESRKQMACEFLLSDPEFASNIQDLYDDVDAVIKKGEKMAQEVAKKTLLIEDNDKAIQYILFYVCHAPDSVQNKLIEKAG
ncbi:MAG: hypothetical protein ACQESP_08050 [Candidatus Muiribacteriota bacterium]